MNRMKDQGILVVEDDAEMRDQVLVPGLIRHGFEHVHGVGSAIEAYRGMLARRFSMFVLDVGLPDESGLAVARHVRSATDAGIVMLTGRRPSKAEQVLGLDAGADAYLAKPIDLDLLAATIRSIFRRRPGHSAATTERATWTLAADGWTLFTPSGVEISLTQGERVILSRFFANKGQPVSRDEIIGALHETNAPGHGIGQFDPHRIELLIHRLRKKVAKYASESFPLNTVRGKGYVFAW
jgi:DNA-binding response OmpR family regulator